MSEKNFEQYNPDESEEQTKQSETSLEMSEIEKDALDKVVDFEKQTDIGITSLGYGTMEYSPDALFLGGIFNTESVLSRGLLPQSLAERAEVPISKFGYGENRFMSDDERRGSVFAYRVNTKNNDVLTESDVWDIDTIVADYHREAKPSRLTEKDKHWFIILDLKNTTSTPDIIYGSNIWGDADETAYGEQVHGRLKPDKIIGILMDKELFSLDIKDYFSGLIAQEPEQSGVRYLHPTLDHTYSKGQVNEIITLIEQLKTTINELNIELTQEDQNTIEETDGEISQLAESLRNGTFSNEPLNDRKKTGDQFKTERLIYQTRSKLCNFYLNKLYDHPSFSEIHTVADYLTMLGGKYKIPIYSLNKKVKAENQDLPDYNDHYSIGLFWPKQMSPDKVKQFVTERDKQKQET